MSQKPFIVQRCVMPPRQGHYIRIHLVVNLVSYSGEARPSRPVKSQTIFKPGCNDSLTGIGYNKGTRTLFGVSDGIFDEPPRRDALRKAAGGLPRRPGICYNTFCRRKEVIAGIGD